MNDTRQIYMSVNALKDATHIYCSSKFKGLQWTCDIDAELPIKMTRHSDGSEQPVTLCQMLVE